MNVTIYNSDNTALVTVTALEDSIISNEIRGDHTLSLSFSSPEFIDIQEGAYVIVNGVTFTLLSQNKIEMTHTRSYEYTVVFESGPAFLSSIVMRNPADGQLSFPYTASAEDHLSLIIANLNRYDSTDEWQIGECQTDGGEKFLQYDYVSCRSALDSIADMFGTEWEISGHTISLHKVEYNLDSPLDLQYGKGFGLRPGIVREVVDRPMTRIYTQGGSKNIDASKYGSAILLLPKSKTFRYDGSKFEDEDGFDVSKARTYTTDSEGTYISSEKNASKTVNEGVIDCTDIYPNKIYNVIDVIDSGSNPREIILDIEEGLDYSQYQILGELPTITFQSGELVGKTFEIRRDQGGSVMMRKSYSDNGAFLGWRVTLSGLYDGGRWIPDAQSGLIPQKGDTCRIFGTRMPDQYVCDDENKSGASWDMLRRGIMYLYEYEDYIYSLKIEIDPIWARKNWSTISQKFVLGGYVKYTNDGWASNGIMMRIQSIRRGVVNPYSIEINLGNGIVGGGVLKGLSDQISRQSGSISEQQSSQKSIEYNVSNMGSDFVTLSTDQTITGRKTFANDVIFGGEVSDGVFGSMFVPSTDGPGKYALVFDSASAVDGEIPTETEGLDVDAMWTELSGSAGSQVIAKEHLPSDVVYDSDLAGYATQAWVQQQGYATQSDLDGRINDLINGAPAAYDTLKEIADVLEGNVDSIGDILTALGGKADKADTLAGYGITDAYTKNEIDEEFAKYVTLATPQTITGAKTFSGDVVLGGGGARAFLPSTAGAGIYSIVFDAESAVDGEVPTESGIDMAAVWTALGTEGEQQIDASHLSGALASYVTQTALSSGLATKVDKVSGMGLSSNDFTDTLLAKLNGIEAGANRYVLPTASSAVLGGVRIGANITISNGVISTHAPYVHPTATARNIEAAAGRVLSAIEVNSLGHVTSVSYKALAAADIPQIPKSKISDFPTTWAWSDITDTPTTLAGYGITDGFNIVQVKGDGNAVSNASWQGHTLTLTRNTTFVDISSEQTISGKKIFSGDAVFGSGSGRLFLPSTSGAGIYSIVFDAESAVDGETPSGVGLDAEAMWQELGGSVSSKVIAIEHIPSIPTSKITGLSDYVWNILVTPGTLTGPKISASHLPPLSDLSGNLDWGRITNTPSTYAPSAHKHEVTDISNLGVRWSDVLVTNLDEGWRFALTQPKPTWLEQTQAELEGYIPVHGDKDYWIATDSHTHDIDEIGGLGTNWKTALAAAKPSWLTSVPKATSSAYGGIKVGYPESGKNYPVELDSSGRAYVSVPWVNTTYSLSSFGITATAAEINKLDVVGTLLHSGNYTSYTYPTTVAKISDLHSSWDSILTTSGVRSRSMTFNGTDYPCYTAEANTSDITWYAPTTAGTSGYVLQSTGGTPAWAAQNSLVVKGIYERHIGVTAGNTMADLKSALTTQMGSGLNKPGSMGFVTTTSVANIMSNWANDDYELVAGARTNFLRLDGYGSSTYGVFLVSGYAGYFYRLLRNDSSTWAGPYTLLDTGNYTSHLDSRYVKKAGDTMTGTLNISSSSEALTRYQISGSNKAASGYLASQGAYLYSYPAGKYLHITDSGLLLFGSSTVWHSGNDGSGSGLDADLLDGYQASSFLLKSGGTMTGNLTLKSMGGTWLSGKTQAPIMTNGASSTNGNTYHPVIWGKTDAGDVWNLGHGASDQVGFFGFYSERTVNGTDWAHYIKVSDGTVHFNKTVYGTTFSGALSGNATSATKLQTARTLWGRPFDGTGNVSGAMTGVTSIDSSLFDLTTASFQLYDSASQAKRFTFNWTSDIARIYAINNSGSGYYDMSLGQTPGNNGALYFDASAARWGIGTTSPAYKLDVAGEIRATSGITIGSTDDYGWYISTGTRISAGVDVARGVNVGSLLVSNAWADYTKVPTNGIYSKGDIITGGRLFIPSSEGNDKYYIRIE